MAELDKIMDMIFVCVVFDERTFVQGSLPQWKWYMFKGAHTHTQNTLGQGHP